LIKLVIIGDYPLQNQYGGASVHMRALGITLASMYNIDVHLVTLGERDFLIEENNIKIHIIGRSKRLYRDFTLGSDAAKLKREIARINPDIVNIDGVYTPYNYLICILKNEYPMLVTMHGPAVEDLKHITFRQILSATINYVLESLILKNIDYISVCSTVLEQSIKKLTDAKIFVIPNGFNFDLLSDRKVENELITHPSILYIGRLAKIKGIEVLIKAVPEIVTKMPNIHIYIAGEGSEKSRLKAIIMRKKLERYVTFLGFISGDNKDAYLKTADLVVIPSLYESFSIALLEAMAYSKPIVASNAGNLPYLINDGVTGILFNSGDHYDLATKSIDVLTNTKLREAIGTNAQKQSQKFTWENTTKLTYKAYMKILRLEDNLSND
jgi:starch synthase